MHLFFARADSKYQREKSVEKNSEWGKKERIRDDAVERGGGEKQRKNYIIQEKDSIRLINLDSDCGSNSKESVAHTFRIGHFELFYP